MVRMLSTVFALFVSRVAGHGHISKPVPRGIAKSEWDSAAGMMTVGDAYATEPQSMGATGGGDEIPICGRANAHVASRKNGDPLEALTPGADFEFEAKITAHHMGHMTVRLCPLIDSSWTYAMVESQCTILTQTGNTEPTNKFWWLDATTGTKKWTATLPQIADLPVSDNGVYTIQWRWNTANSCCPHKKAYGCHPTPAWCHGECLVGQETCTGEALDLYDGSSGSQGCADSMCCSEVFTNCADASFVGVNYELPAGDDATAQTSPATADVESTPTSSGGNAAANTGADCIAKAGWAGQQHMDDWCAAAHACGDDGGETCDCNCDGSSVSTPDVTTPEHHVWPATELRKKWDDFGFDTSALTTFCKNNKHLVCSNTNTYTGVPELCDCLPVPAPVPAPEPEPTTEVATEVAPAVEPEPATEASTHDCSSGTCPCDDGTAQSCKTQCFNKCNSNPKVNQCWGSPRHIQCECEVGVAADPIPGCGCEKAEGCGSLAQVNSTVHSTKFSRHTLQSHHALSVDATGRAKPLSLDEKH